MDASRSKGRRRRTTDSEPGDRADAREVADTLNAICNAAVQAGRSGDAAAVAEIRRRLERQSERFRGAGRPEVAAFMAGLSNLLGGSTLERALEDVEGPYRQGLRAVAADLRASGRAPEGRPRQGEDAPRPVAREAAPERDDPPATERRPADAGDDAGQDWVAALTAHVADLLRARDRQTARALAAELERTARQPGVDPDAAAYLEVLLGVLRGQKLGPRVLQLQEPYRSAYGSLQALMRGQDPRAGLLERVTHNAGLVMKSDNPEAREGLESVLEDVEQRAERLGEAELARFVGSLRRLLDGELEADRAAEIRFEDSALRSSWDRIVALWQRLTR